MDQRICRRFCDALDTFDCVVEQIAEDCAEVCGCDWQAGKRVRRELELDALFMHGAPLGCEQGVYFR